MAHPKQSQRAIRLQPDEAPQWLSIVPDQLLAVTDGRSGTMHPTQLPRVLTFLSRHSLPRPTLWEWECERKRRRLR